MRHRIVSVIIAFRRSYTGPEHAHVPLIGFRARAQARPALSCAVWWW
jgi:hypothetical protein